MGALPYKKGKFGDTCTPGKQHMKRKAEIRAMHLPAKKHQKLKAWNRFSLTASEETNSLDLDLGLSACRAMRQYISVF